MSIQEGVYICILRSDARAMGFKIIPRHPLNMAPLKILDYDEGMNNINWEKMELRDYFDYECKEICMAESVFRGDLSINSFYSIHVINSTSKKYVEDLLGKVGGGNIHVYESPNYFI